MDHNNNQPKGEDVEFIKVGNTTYEVTSFYSGETSLVEIIKNALKRDVQAVLRQMTNN
jgi:hypothetical protein